MESINRGEKNNNQIFLPIKLTNGRLIKVASIENDQIAKHRDGRECIIKVMGITNQYNPEEAMVLDASKFIAFEVEKERIIDEELVKSVLVEYFRKRSEDVCTYIGEYNPQSHQFDRYSEAVQKYIQNNLSKKLKQRMDDQNNKRKSTDISVKNASEDFIDSLRKRGQEKNNDIETLKMERIQHPFLIYKGTIQKDKKNLENYDGVNILTGEIIRLRQLELMGIDGSGTYLYNGYIRNVFNDEKSEVLGTGTPLGTHICFETRNKIQDIMINGNIDQIKQLLYFFSNSGIRGYEKKGLYYIGKIDKNGNITRNKESDSPAIKKEIERLTKEDKMINEGREY